MTETTEKHFNREVWFRDHRIWLNDNYTFTVEWPEGITVQASYTSLNDAKGAIERVLEAHEKAERIAKREKFNYPVLNSWGEDAVITGVHATQGRLLVKPHDQESRGVYPAVPWLKALLQEERRLRARMHEINKATRHYYISDSGYHASRSTDLEGVFAKIAKDVTEKQVKAEAVKEPMQPKYL